VPDLADQIAAEADVSFDQGRTNNLTDLVLIFGAIIASTLATILAGVTEDHKAVVASVAALPGLCASLQRIVDFRGRSAWHFVKYAKLRELELNLRYDPTQLPPDAAKQFGAILKEMEGKWAELATTRPYLPGEPPPKTDTSPGPAKLPEQGTGPSREGAGARA
jgi:hypothetical protein